MVVLISFALEFPLPSRERARERGMPEIHEGGCLCGAVRYVRRYFFQQEGTMKRSGSAVWKGGLKDGKDSISTESGVLSNTQYGFNARFENGPGTNPEELIGAA